MYDFALIFAFCAQYRRHQLPMMPLTREQIARIAHLARLELSAAEMPVYRQSLVAHPRADRRSCDACRHRRRRADGAPAAGQSQRLRDDVVTETDQHELYQAQRPAVAAGLYLVPKVIE